MSDFWDEMSGAFVGASSLDSFLSERGRSLEGSQFKSVRGLTQMEREANALPLPVEAGTRVRFVANLGSVLTYDDVPHPRIEGTVVTVKTGAGKTTSLDERVFVLWDDGKFRPILAEHLRQAGVTSKKSHSVRMVVSDLGDISSFFTAHNAGSGDELIHRATKDLWSFRKDGDQFVIERLFKDNGEPLKV